MPWLTDLALMMRIDSLDLIFGLREFSTVAYGRTVVHVFPGIRVDTQLFKLNLCQWWNVL